VYLTSEEAAQSTLFLYEPDLISQIAGLLLPAHETTDGLGVAAVTALDACAHHRSKLTEVLNAVSANVSHGILLTLFREVVDKLMADGK